ncbi:MAG TPA: GIY-YIG nuclease family protein [Candidatus Deferrimicrobium sp.]|nr:GIY-YIG nuclease family protein [Candidatus Deferrimicrobium sp.]
MSQFYVYILKCEKDNSYYTGYTSDLTRRIKEHNSGKGAKYTRARGPVDLQYVEQYETRKRAMQREREIKKLSRKKKTELWIS